MERKKKKKPTVPRDPFGRPAIEVLTRRLEAMEMREQMLKERLDVFARNEAALTSLRAACTELMAMQCAVYDAVANLYDLLRMPQAAERMRDEKATLRKT